MTGTFGPPMPQQLRQEFKPIGRACVTDTAVLEQGLKRAFPLDRRESFEELLAAIDAAEKQAEHSSAPCVGASRAD